MRNYFIFSFFLFLFIIIEKFLEILLLKIHFEISEFRDFSFFYLIFKNIFHFSVELIYLTMNARSSRKRTSNIDAHNSRITKRRTVRNDLNVSFKHSFSHNSPFLFWLFCWVSVKSFVRELLTYKSQKSSTVIGMFLSHRCYRTYEPSFRFHRMKGTTPYIYSTFLSVISRLASSKIPRYFSLTLFKPVMNL